VTAHCAFALRTTTAAGCRRNAGSSVEKERMAIPAREGAFFGVSMLRVSIVCTNLVVTPLQPNLTFSSGQRATSLATTS